MRSGKPSSVSDPYHFDAVEKWTYKENVGKKEKRELKKNRLRFTFTKGGKATESFKGGGRNQTFSKNLFTLYLSCRLWRLPSSK